MSTPITTDVRRRSQSCGPAGDELPSHPTITHHFGSLDALRAELGQQAGAKLPEREWLPAVRQRWDRERIVTTIKAFAGRHGRPPTTTDWKRAGVNHPDPETVARHFGSFGAALSAAGFAPRRFSWSREEIVAAIDVHLSEHGRLPTPRDWRERDPSGKRPALHNVHQLFGSWDKAIEAAGHPVERWDRETILDALRELGRELGRRPKHRDIAPKRPGLPGHRTIIAEFGSLTTALNAAGFEVPRQWAREEAIAALHAWTSEHGRPPGYKDWSRGSDSHPVTSVVEKLFGSWTEALIAADLPIVKRNWDRKAILVALRAWDAEHGRAPKSADWRGADPTGSRPATFRVQREFGTWAAALRAAGLAGGAKQRAAI
jgi:AcrR family transcriptional regulator